MATIMSGWVVGLGGSTRARTAIDPLEAIVGDVEAW